VAPDDTSSRRRAAALAGHSDDPATALAALDDASRTVRIAGLRSLARLGRLTDAQLGEALSDLDPSVRIAAIELAAHRNEPPIGQLLDDNDPMVVESTAWALGERPGAPTPIIEKLSTITAAHDDPLVRESAVAALGAIGDERGLPAILAATRDKPAVRRRAVIALAAFEGPEVDAAWARARSDRDRQVRDAVDELLGPVDETG
jgi:HEAT repeat protein